MGPSYFWAAAAAAWAATSAAKSVTFFSMPSPTMYRVKPATEAPLAFSSWATMVCLPSSALTKTWPSRVTSFRNFWTCLRRSSRAWLPACRPRGPSRWRCGARRRAVRPARRGVEGLRLGRGDVHRQILGQGFVAADQVDQHADLGAAVDVAGDSLPLASVRTTKRRIDMFSPILPTSALRTSSTV